ncbi:agmatine deiminase family protein [Kitasatospora sp. McL0602]|uniref:agmatine deiminase family protein n=1 Tax=Kitasatospora sp. McL0602 TaxID=3439530 RepID=UPI003F8B4FF2
MTTPASLGFRMPAEWHPHERTWMAFPTDNPTFDEPAHLHAAREAWARVANTIVRYEPVTLIVNTGELEDARRYVSAEVELVERPLDDAWMRDIGPTFLLGRDGELAATDWVFNGWGAQSWARWEHDQHIAEAITGLTDVQRFASKLINEGGGIHVDGEGTVLVTETVQLGEGRNSDWTKEAVEAELHAFLGTTKAIWLPRGLTRDYDEFGTRGHIDIVASFVRPGVVLAHVQPDPAHPDHEVCKELVAILRASTDAAGRPLEVIELPAPTVLTDEEGEPVDYSYINHYVANGAVILCAFDDPRDQHAATVLGEAYPGRKVELVDAREIFANGGGIHCITQQQPRATR